MTTPAISIVMPAYNAERFLEEAIDSMLAQTFTDFELVAVDDGSTDRTREILEGYERADERVRVLSAAGKGFVDALTTGVAAARADLIARLDADDRSTSDRLQRQWDFLRGAPEVGLVGSAAQVIDDAGRPLHVVRFPLADPVIRLTLRYETAFAHGAVLMRRGPLVAVGGYRAAAHPADDYDLWCRLVASGVQAANIDEPLYEYRMHGEGISRTRPAEMEQMAQQVGRAYGRSLRGRPTWVELHTSITEVAGQVDAGTASPRALRRTSRSLLGAARRWSAGSPLTAAHCFRGAVLAEVAYRRSVRRAGA